jgi:hypothetical protein
VITHLGLLFWEMRYVSANLAHPALKPKAASAGSSNVIDVDASDAAPSPDPAPAQKEF